MLHFLLLVKAVNSLNSLAFQETFRARPRSREQSQSSRQHMAIECTRSSTSGPETCSVVSKLLAEEDTEAWGVEPYDLEDADGQCKALVRKAIVRVADVKFPLPYRPKSFDLVIVSDALDYLSPRYLNKTLPDLARVSRDGVVVFAGDY